MCLRLDEYMLFPLLSYSPVAGAFDRGYRVFCPNKPWELFILAGLPSEQSGNH